MKLRLAQSFEEADDWEHATNLYEELYKSEPSNYIYMDGLRRSYTQLKEYDKAINIIRRWLTTHPREINLLSTLGGIYFDSGDETAADSIWRVALQMDPNNVQSYRIVANEMMQHRLFERCIQTYLAGRNSGKSEILFADELGTIYGALQQYTHATQEYLRLIKKSPDQLPLVQSRLLTLSTRPEALRAVTAAVRSEVESARDNIALHRLYGLLLMQGEQYESALEEYREIDRLSNAHGNELFNFAQQLNQEHASKTAMKAFQDIIDLGNNTALLFQAQFGYARALEDVHSKDDSASSPSKTNLQDAIRLYESIVETQGHPDLSAQSLYRIGNIKFDSFFDLDGALNAFQKIKKIPNAANLQYDATLKCGDVQLARNDVGEAQKEFDAVATLPSVSYQDQAKFKLAELFYFEAHFDTALTLLKRFQTNLNTDLSNDALQLQYFIEENRTTALPALTEFAKADLLRRQRKYSESLNLFRTIIQEYPSAMLVDDAQMNIGELYIKLGQPTQAITAFQFVADSIQLSILKDKAQFRIAEISETILHNPPQAIEAYQKLLEQFPNSLYAEEARKRVRLLRGDSL